MFAVGGTLGAADVGVGICPLQQIHFPVQEKKKRPYSKYWTGLWSSFASSNPGSANNVALTVDDPIPITGLEFVCL